MGHGRAFSYIYCGLLVAIIAWPFGSSEGMSQGSPSAFTQAQVMAGRASHHGYCSGCHGDNLQGGGTEGGGDAPPLTGPLLNQDWSKYTIRVLYQFVSKTMPAGLEGDLSPKTYANILSFLLAANGAKPGLKPLDPRSGIRIGDIANGHLVTAITRAPVDPRALIGR